VAETLPSISKRVSRSLILISLVWGVAVSVVIGAVVDHEVDEIMDATLRESAQILQPLLSANALRLPLGSAEAMPAPAHSEEVVWQIVDAQRGVLLRSHDAPTQPMTSVENRDIVTAPNGWRVLVSAFDGQGRLLMVGQVGRERREAKWDAVLYTVVGALLVGVLGAFWLRHRLRHELLPLSALTKSVARFDPLQPGSTLAEVNRQELRPVRDAIATLGASLASRVARERSFSAHAAHALRTPLAGMMAQLAAAQRVSPADAQPMLTLARQAADRLRRVVSAILTLFRSGSEVHWQRVDLAALLAQLQVEGLAIKVERPAELEADPDLLAAALSNLLDNAARHGASGVQVEVRSQGKGYCIALSDDGPGISEDQRLLLQAALTQQTYQSPLGMGLMLADLVARAHGGALRVPPCTAGCRVELHIGSASAAPKPA
jgi:signal transduction histidine kinase